MNKCYKNIKNQKTKINSKKIIFNKYKNKKNLIIKINFNMKNKNQKMK